MDENIQAIVDELLTMIGAANEAGTEAASAPAEDYEAPVPPAMEGASPEDLRAAMDYVMDELNVPEAEREAYYDSLEADYEVVDGRAVIENLNIVVNNTNITNDTDNSITLEEGAEARNIYQENDTTNANATGDGAVAGEDLHGAQVVTGEGANVVGDSNSGVNFGENSGQVAGGEAIADDFVGDGSVNNEGTIEDSAFGLGENSYVANTADDSTDYSTNDSYNTEGSYNNEHSSDIADSYNQTSTEEATYDIDAHVDAAGGYEKPVEYPEVDEHCAPEDDYAPEEPEYLES